MIAKCKGCGDTVKTPAQEYQETTYGKGQRVMNELPSKGKEISARCTCCGTVTVKS